MPVVNVKLNESIDFPPLPSTALHVHQTFNEPLMSLSFVGEVKGIEFVESQNLCSVNEQKSQAHTNALKTTFN